MLRSLVVKVTVGADAPERCNQGLMVAATAASSGTPVSLWLAGEATWLAVPGRANDIQLALATPFADLLAIVLAEGTVTACTQCASRRGLMPGDLLEGVRIAGAATFTEEILAEHAQALVY